MTVAEVMEIPTANHYEQETVIGTLQKTVKNNKNKKLKLSQNFPKLPLSSEKSFLLQSIIYECLNPAMSCHRYVMKVSRDIYNGLNIYSSFNFFLALSCTFFFFLTLLGGRCWPLVDEPWVSPAVRNTAAAWKASVPDELGIGFHSLLCGGEKCLKYTAERGWQKWYAASYR